MIVASSLIKLPALSCDPFPKKTNKNKASALRDVQSLEKELNTAMADLEKERESAKANIDDQVNALAEEILGRVLPDGEMPKEEPAGAA